VRTEIRHVFRACLEGTAIVTTAGTHACLDQVIGERIGNGLSKFRDGKMKMYLWRASGAVLGCLLCLPQGGNSPSVQCSEQMPPFPTQLRNSI
jgi:hypothetical protein